MVHQADANSVRLSTIPLGKSLPIVTNFAKTVLVEVEVAVTMIILLNLAPNLHHHLTIIPMATAKVGMPLK